jgi:hypothetical protein
MITRMLLASVLAIGAGCFAGCGDSDCPSAFAGATSCSGDGLVCGNAGVTCTCHDGQWDCVEGDLPMVVRDMTRPDMANLDMTTTTD